MKDKKKPSYSMLSNIIFIFKLSWRVDKLLLFTTVIKIPIIVLLPLLTTYLSKYVVQLVTDQVDAVTLILHIIGLSAMLLILNLIDTYVSSKVEWRAFGNRFQYINICMEKTMDMDYENFESPDGQNKMHKAVMTVFGNGGGTQQIFMQFINIVSNVIGLITYSALIFNLNPWIILLLVGITIINYIVNTTNNKWVHNNKDSWIPIDRKVNYIKYRAGDFGIAKDIRMYGMSKWFSNMFEIFFADRNIWYKKGEKRYFIIDILSGLMTFIRDGAAYGFLIYAVVEQGMSAADFVLYFGFISQYSNWLLGLINSYNTLHRTSLEICDLREFLDIEDHFNRDEGIVVPDESPEIIFENVSFKYPNSDGYTLKDLNVRIKKGENIAIVGLNGAGKTTMVKLLCGLYTPTEGRITVNGHDIVEYNINDYYKTLSVVFQDIHVMPTSIAKNISLCKQDKIDHERLTNVLHASGLYDKVQTLPEHENTILMKSIYENATDLSGGEMQKLALARALYKNGRIIILDEPTAALDPIAENELYQKYNHLTDNTTSLFISHRLSSTRFCDRIIFLKDGQIIEEGTHDELTNISGNYSHLFELQSHYYKDQRRNSDG